MRVALISHSAHLCGGERMLLNLATGLAESGRARVLLVVPGQGPMLSVPVPSGCRILPLAEQPNWYLYFPHGDASTRGTYLGKTLEQGRRLLAPIRDWGPDVVVVNTLTTLLGLVVAAELNLPLLTWIHGILDASFGPFTTREKNACDELLLRCSAHLVCPSEWTARFFREQYQLPLTVIPNAAVLPGSVPPPPTGVTTFCCLNTWESNKGLLTLFDAALLLSLRGYDFRLDLHGAGAPAFETMLRGRIESYQLGDRVRMHGRTDNPGAVYAGSHALVTCSEMESFGLTVVEAMSYGRPVIASDSSGHREIVRDEFGFLCPTRDAFAFADRMAWVIDHPAEAARMGQRGAAVARDRYSFTRLVEDFSDLFGRLVARERTLTPADVMHRFAPGRLLASLQA